ncbi:FAD-binding oxidoreductase [Streptomyces sp900105245]|uniref:FAD-binding oxidoreductase n=1 Tax=Streptomyces sp. 900105245 TaxID=3154379 RepID=UPI0033165F05
MSGDTVPVTGWGRTAPTVARVIRPRTYEEAAAAVRDCGTRGAVARGLGRAHGDAAQNAGGAVLDMTGLDRVHVIDAAEGIVLCDAGISLRRLTEVLLPLGWLPPVAPGTRHVTVGGAIGADVHGRNQHVSGSFCRHVLSLELLTADGEVRTVRPGTPLFEATTGGLGLTGVILTATFRLLPVETAYLTVRTERAAGLDDLLARMTTGDHRHRYSAAWIDLLARGPATGRAVLRRADHTPLDALGGHTRVWRQPLSAGPRRLPAPAALVPDGLLGRTTAGLLNELRHRTAPRARTGRIQHLSAYFHPLDGLPHRNRLYGRGGFVQYQFVLGHGREEVLHRVVRRIAAHRCPSLLAVLQRFGDGDPGWLSFPVPGWSLTLDVPAALPGLPSLLDGLDEEIAAAGGRVCLAKDSRLRPELLAAMYPRVADFRALRAELDPRGVFVSDLARRLDLHTPRS